MDLIKNNKNLKIIIEKINGSTLIDAGIKSEGSTTAGLIVSKICMGDLAEIDEKNNKIIVESDNPVLACLGCQYAGWKINIDKFFALGSGPARALSDVEESLFSKLNYKDNYDKAIICLETRKVPNSKILDYISGHCRVKKEDLYVILIPTSSLIGSVQISARVLETAIHQLFHLNFQIDTIIKGYGTCPIPPVLPSDELAMGLTNDAIIMMGEVNLNISGIDDYKIEKIISKIPSVYSKDFGEPFSEIFKKAGYDFYKIDPLLFSPAKINVYNITTGSEFSFGKINPELYKETIIKYQEK